VIATWTLQPKSFFDMVLARLNGLIAAGECNAALQVHRRVAFIQCDPPFPDSIAGTWLVPAVTIEGPATRQCWSLRDDRFWHVAPFGAACDATIPGREQRWTC
jgi:hypothetical protein